MKKSQLIKPVSLALITMGLLASCGNNKKDSEADSLKTMEDMVEAVERPVPGINGTEYNSAFFTDTVNRGDTASSMKYAETTTGLKYVIVKEGNGKQPTATDKVTVHYVGTLPNGFQFDSSIDRGEPTTFPLNGVIPGWTEGLQLMKEGGTAVFYIPGNLAYGEQGIFDRSSGTYMIPPNSPLIFWVELIQVN